MSHEIATDVNKNMSRPVFFFGRAISRHLNFYLSRKCVPNGHVIRRYHTKSQIFFLADISRDLECVERTLIYEKAH